MERPRERESARDDCGQVYGDHRDELLDECGGCRDCENDRGALF